MSSTRKNIMSDDAYMQIVATMGNWDNNGGVCDISLLLPRCLALSLSSGGLTAG
jgi:hypothetical protein